MGCSGSSTAARSPSKRYDGGSHARSPPAPATVADGGVNEYEVAYVNQMVKLASVLGDYERGRYDIGEARDLADQYMRSFAEISTRGHVNYQRTRVLMERRGLSDHSRRHLENLYKALQEKTRDPEAKLNVHQHLHLWVPLENCSSNEKALQRGPHPTLLPSPVPEQQQAIYHSDKPQTADGWAIEGENVRRIHHREQESCKYEHVWDWICRGGISEAMGFVSSPTVGSDGWTVHGEQYTPKIGIMTSRVRYESREVNPPPM